MGMLRYLASAVVTRDDIYTTAVVSVLGDGTLAGIESLRMETPATIALDGVLIVSAAPVEASAMPARNVGEPLKDYALRLQPKIKHTASPSMGSRVFLYNANGPVAKNGVSRLEGRTFVR